MDLLCLGKRKQYDKEGEEMKYGRMEKMKWTVLSDNRTNDSQLETEHGLSILLETDKHCILLDTGASDVFIRPAIVLVTACMR